jgi:hypothetical protein
MHDLSGPSGIEQPPPVVQQPSLAPGVQAAAPAAQTGPQRFSYDDPAFRDTLMSMYGSNAEDAQLQDQAGLIASLRSKGKHTTGIGGAIGAAGDILNTLALKKNMDKRSDLSWKSQQDWLKYAAETPSIQERGGEGY